MTTGQKIGNYRVCRILGRGGMGVVYEVEDSAGTHYALKLFSSEAKNRAFLAKRFRVEARLLAGLDHPHLVKVRDVGKTEDAPFFTMDLVLNAHGEPETLEDARRRGGIPQEQLLRWFHELSDALAYLHARGIAHRDIKLENVLVDAEGHAVLSDFGISRILSDELRQELNVTKTFIEGQTTGTRPVMGTYFYLAPELRKGGEATAASDLYALGVLFFRLLTGLWYEPQDPSASASPFDLLMPFDPFWQDVIPRLLADAPAARTVIGITATAPRIRRGRRIALGAVCAAAVAAGVWGWSVFFRNPPPSRPQLPSTTFDQGVLRLADFADLGGVDIGAVTSLVICGSAKDIPPNTFQASSNLCSVVVENGIRKIGNVAFFGCPKLETVTIADSVTSIGAYAFGDCFALREVRCGSGLKEVGQAAFGGCRSLQNIYFAGDAPKPTGVRILVRTPETLVNHVRPDAKGWGDRWPLHDNFSRTVSTAEKPPQKP
ncbi:MAG: protein kinase [Kiritimatiellae bacterium]|nr:protein kinase [Kiritimatiellia bacterium]